jgi:hypothetical protein
VLVIEGRFPPMTAPAVRWTGATFVLAYGGFIAWLYATQPQSVVEVTGGLAAQVGAYEVDVQAYADGMSFFEKDAFDAARAAWKRADPAARDSKTQFYVAYSYSRQGWGRLYNDDASFRQGLETIDRAIAVAPAGRVVVDDPKLGIHSADELRSELAQGLRRDSSDLNPLRLFRSRK